MNHPLLSLIRRMVQEEVACRRTALLGEVIATYPHAEDDDANNYEVDVRLKHEDLTLYRVPVAIPFMGWAAPPQAGDLVLVHFLDGDLNQPLIGGSFYHADERPPLCKEGEILLEQRLENGKLNHIRLSPDGAIYIQQDVTEHSDSRQANAGIVISSGGDITITSKNQAAGIVIGSKGEITITGAKLTIEAETVIHKKLEVGNGSTTTIIDGNQIQGS